MVAYKKLHKNTLVPRQYNEDPKLGPWVHTQRKNYRNDDILPKRLALLNSIYFKWEGAKAARDQMAWMNEHVSKNCRVQNVAYENTIVPFHYQEDPKLGYWVSQQRKKIQKRRTTSSTSRSFEID